MKKPWPDLEKRARIEKKRLAEKTVLEDREKLRAQLGRVGDFLQKFIDSARNSANAVNAAEGEQIAATEDEFVEHVKTCANCRRHVAELARAGVKLSPRVLSAAGVEMLN